jgi:hypothetical protein
MATDTRKIAWLQIRGKYHGYRYAENIMATDTRKIAWQKRSWLDTAEEEKRCDWHLNL